MTKSPSPTDFYLRLKEIFPEEAKIVRADESGFGILHVEVGTFSRLTEDALEADKLWRARCHLSFVEELLDADNSELENTLAVSYLENVFWAPRSTQKSKLLEPYLGKRSRRLLDALITHMNRIHAEN